MGLLIRVESNLSNVNILDINLNLHVDKFKPNCKPNEKIYCVSKESSRQVVILKNLASNIERQISSISSHEITFQNATPYYNNKLRNSRFSEKIQYNQANSNNNRQPRTRTRKVLWFNHTFKTNIRRGFLKLVSKHFHSSNKF